MKIGYPDTKNKLGGSSPLYATDPDKKKRRYQVLPDPKVTKPKVARQMKRDGVITKEQFRTYKDQYKANNTRRRPAITSGDISRDANTKGDGGPNEEFQVAVPRGKWKRLQRKKKRALHTGRGKKSTQKLDEKVRLKSPRVREYKKIPKEERTPEELKYRIDIRDVEVSDTKKAARKRYKKYKRENK